MLVVVNDYPAHVVEFYEVEPTITDQELARLLFGAADATSGFAHTAGRLRRVNHTTALAAFASHLEGLFHSLRSPPREEGLTLANVKQRKRRWCATRQPLVTSSSFDHWQRPAQSPKPSEEVCPPPMQLLPLRDRVPQPVWLRGGGGAVALEVAKSVVPRPPTDARVARRMLVHALGLSPKRQNTTDN